MSPEREADVQPRDELAMLKEEVSDLNARLARYEKGQQALLESLRFYHLLAESVGDVIWAMDPGLRYTYISPSVTHVRGYEPQETAGLALRDVVHESSYELARRVFEEEMELARGSKAHGYRSRTMEVQLRHKDGSTRWAEVKFSVSRDEGGAPAGFVGITRDIEERKRAEQERRTLLQRQQAILENVPAMIFLKDSEMRYITANRAYFEMLPRMVNSLAGRRDRDFFPRGMADRFEAEDMAVLREGLTIRKEEPVRVRDGRVLQMAVSITPVRAEGGEITGMVGIAYDITERKEAQERLENYAAELEKANARLAQLMEEVRSLSLKDELTGLYNRRGFLALAEQQLKIANRAQRTASLFFFDLDGMKAINDSLGHARGDAALAAVADVLRASFRDSDILARIGGDEFVVMAVESHEGMAGSFLDRLKDNLQSRNDAGTEEFKLSLSSGVAHYDPANPCSMEELLARADKLMYAQKRLKNERLRAGKEINGGMGEA